MNTEASGTELLAPAGNMEKLKVAVAFGADAVYFGLKRFSLRNFAGNFDISDVQKAMDYLHRHSKKGYAALNIYPFGEEYPQIISIARQLEQFNVDGLIVSDLGVINELKKNNIEVPVHISTQANTLSPQTVMAYKELGATRVNIARELSFEQIKKLQKNISDIETEVFIHGAVCFSYSGRCAISDYLTGRRANRGECTHPCRWQYSLVEQKRPGEYLPVFEDDRGLYLFDSRDLALFSYVKELAEAGVKSFKIEGRMKSIHYIASVVSLYRSILDGKKIEKDSALTLLKRVMNRGYSEGFMKGEIVPSDYRFDNNTPHTSAKFLGIVAKNVKDGAILDIRNKIEAGFKAEALLPDGTLKSIEFPQILTDTDGETHTHVSHGRKLFLPWSFPKYTVIRRILE
jgi:putative protease